MALTTGLISYWKLDANSNDTVGSNNGTDTSVSYGNAGKIGNCATFSSGSSINCGAASNLNLSVFTIAFWLKTAAANSSIVSHMDAAGPFKGYAVDVSGNFIRLHTGSTFGGSNDITGSVSVVDDAWHYILCTYNNTTTTGFVYVDNVQDVTSTSLADNTPPSTTPNYYINAAYDGASGRNAGKIDEMAVWNRVLTSTERGQLYNGGAGLAYPLVPATAGGSFLFNFI